MSTKKIISADLSAGFCRISHSMNLPAALVVLADMMILFSTGMAIYGYYLGWEPLNPWPYFIAILTGTFVVAVAFYREDLYSSESIFNPIDTMPKILRVLAVVFLLFLAIIFSLKISDQFSRVWLFSWFLTAFALILLERSLYSTLFYRWAKAGELSRNIVIVGSGEQAKMLLWQLNNRNDPWFNIIGIFDDRKERVGPSFSGVPVIGSLDDLLDYARNNRVDDIIVTLPWSADQRLMETIAKLEELPVHIRLGSDLAGYLR